MADMSQIEAKSPQSQARETLLWEQYPTTPLTAEEQARFEELTWVNPKIIRMERPQPHFGIWKVIVGGPTQVVMITQEEEGKLVKRVIPEEETEAVMLGSGPSAPERTVYANDSFVDYGPADHRTARRKVTFQKGINVNSQTIQRAIEVAEDFQVAVQQDATSRQIKQAERDLLDNLEVLTQDPTVKKLLLEKLGTKLQEAAIESGLIQASRTSLPDRIRSLAGEIEGAGIKCMEFQNGQDVYWPDGIRKSWTPDTDHFTWKEWAHQELPRPTVQPLQESA